MPRPKFDTRTQSIHKQDCIRHILRYKNMLAWSRKEFRDFAKAHDVNAYLRRNNDFVLAKFRDIMKTEFQNAYK